MKQIANSVVKLVLLNWRKLEPLQNDDLKTMTKTDLEALTASILARGMTSAFQGWEHKGKVKVLDGHQRLRALKVLEKRGHKIDLVPVLLVAAKNEKEAREILLSNVAQYAKVSDEGLYRFMHDTGMDFAQLSKEFVIPGVDLESFGASYFKDVTFSAKESDEDEVPEVSEKVTTKPGQIFKLGKHRLMCGDSSKATEVHKLMGAELADMVFTDPPYNHGSENQMRALSDLRPNSYGKLKDAAWDKNFSFGPVGAVLLQVLAPDASVYVTTSHHLAGEIWAWAKEWAQLTGYCTWTKPNPMPSMNKRHWTWATEIVCYATRGKHVFNFPEEGHALNYWSVGKQGEAGLHPTMKPVGVPEHAISHSSSPDARILDLFGGAGSTLIACEKTERRCFMMEIDPHYCDVIIARWQKYSGKKAELLSSPKKSKAAGTAHQPAGSAKATPPAHPASRSQKPAKKSAPPASPVAGK